MPVTHPTATPSTTAATGERLAELVQRLTSCPHLVALDAVDEALAAGGDDALLVVARAIVGLRTRADRPSLRLARRP